MRPLSPLASVPLRVQLTLALVLLVVGIATILGVISHRLLVSSLLDGAVDAVNHSANALRISAFSGVSEKRDHVGSTLKTIELGCGISGLMNTSCAKDSLRKFVASEHGRAARLRFDKGRSIEIGHMSSREQQLYGPFATVLTDGQGYPYFVVSRTDASSGLRLDVEFEMDTLVTGTRQGQVDSMLVTRQGSDDVVLGSGKLPAELANSARLQACISGNDHTADAKSAESLPYIAATMQVPEVQPLCAVAITPTQLALAPATNWRSELTSAKLILAVIGLVLAYTFANLVTYPLRKIKKRIRAFREGDYASPFPIVGTGELRELATALSDMATSVNQARDELLRSEERMTLACQAANLWIWQHDLKSGKIQWSDPSKVRPAFLSANFRGLLRRLYPEDRHAMCVAVRTAKLTGLYTCEYRTYDMDGNLVWIASWGQVQSKRDGIMIGVCLDVTARKRAEGLAIEKEKLDATSQMAAALAHEINNPLTSIISAVYMADSAQVSPEQKNYLRIAEQESRRVAQIAKQILSLYRKPTMAEAIDFKSLLDFSITSCTAAIERKNLVMQREIEYLGRIIGYRDELRHAISNLLTNAIECAPPNSVIRIRARQSHSWKYQGEKGVRVLVSNAGPGIPKESLASMFEPFTGTKAERGTGLGLWVTRVAVVKQGGTIRIRSGSMASPGTAVGIYLPNRIKAPASAPAEKMSNLPPAAVG